MFKKNVIIDCNTKKESKKIIDFYLKDGYTFKNKLINDDIKSNSLLLVINRFKEIELFQNLEKFNCLKKERGFPSYSNFENEKSKKVLKYIDSYIENLEKKLKGELPITKEDLFKLISSHGITRSFNSCDNINIEKCKPKECYDLSNLDVSQLDDLAEVFRYSMYNGDLSKWDTSNCTNMFAMFEESKFNNNSLKDWNMSNVKNIAHMFLNAKDFNGDLSNWNTSNVKIMKSMFSYTNFNNDSLKNWDVSNVENMYYIFAYSKFNGDISKWNISNVINMNEMFFESKFDGDISKWKFNENINCVNIFYNNKNFENKYNNMEILPIESNEFLKWFKDNKDNIKEININENIQKNKNTLDSFLKEKGINKDSDLGKQLIEVYNEKQNKLKQDLENIEELKSQVYNLAETDFFRK